MAIGGFLTQRAEEAYRSPEDLQANRNMANLGASLIESGMEKLGSPRSGKAVADYLRAEWYREEDKTFQATVGKDVQTKLEQTQNNYKLRTKLTQEMGVEGQDPAELRKGYYSEYTPDGTPVATSFIPADDYMAVNQHLNTAASDMIGGLQNISMEYMDAAAQYPNNPMIENRAKQLMTHIQSSFEGQLTAAKIAGEQMQQQEALMDMEKKKRDAEFEKELLPKRREAEVAKLDAGILDFRKEQLVTRAQVARGRELAAAAGVDVSTFDDNDSLEWYIKHDLEVQDQIKQVELAKKSGKNLLPPGIDLTNVGDWLRFSAPGNAVLANFLEEERQTFLGSDPATKERVEAKAKAMGYDNFDEIEDPKVKQAIRQEILNLDPEVRDAISRNAVRKATEYLINTGQLGASFGVGKGNPKGVEMPTGAGMPPARIKLFESGDSMMRELLPEEYEEEVAAEVEVPETTDEGDYFSGDSEDPFGDESIAEDSPLNPVVQEREINTMNGYEEWLQYFSANPNTPKSIRISNSKRALKDIDAAIENLRKRQSLPGQGLPEDAYDAELARLKDMRGNFELLLKDPEHFVPVPTFGTFEAIKNARKMVKLMMEDVTDGIAYLEDPSYAGVPLQGQRQPGIFVPKKEEKRRGGQRILEGALPYWMASPEEKKARMARFEETLRTGRL